MADQTQGAYLPVTADDANRQQLVARGFQLVADYFAGTDAQLRNEPGMTNTSGIMGPRQSGVDIGIGQGGEVFIRGSAGQVAATQNAPQPAPAGPAALLRSPLVMAAGAVLLLWYFTRSRG